MAYENIENLHGRRSEMLRAVIAENSYLQLDDIDEGPMHQVLGCSVSYRIEIRPQQGRKVFPLQTMPAVEEDDRFAQVAKESGFSPHAGVAAQAWEW
jgi:hypothetical protein